MHPLDQALSLETAQRIKSKAHASFENAYRAALATAEAIYVQGFLVMAGKRAKLVEHSWLELGDRIIDPSLPHLNRQPEDLSYFAAQRLSLKQLKAAVEEAREDYPEDDPLPIYGAGPYEYYGEVMLGGKDYQEAYAAAVAKRDQLARSSAEHNGQETEG